ncbi:MAG: asparagine synthase (glutamine-hydrolyzing) [Acidobacteria bacterium]|nr:asparagine synthase (glutamine-hydrolyzing) [Acidobacteriota bacterium]
MCGICGIFHSRTNEPVSRDLITAMCRVITHRGPDDEGLYIDGPVGLGVRRLSIIDVAGGHQPLDNEDGSMWAAHNGEVYNFPELREELKGLGHRFKTRTDTETVLHAYEEWGLEFASRLRGMYATAIWDGRKERLVIVRDRLGIKPLYYSLSADGTLVFGSELKTILEHPEIERRVDAQALDFFLTLEYIPAPRSIFEGIHKLPAGHMLICSRNEFKVQRYWDLADIIENSNDTPPASIPAVKEELRGRLMEAVRLRLLSDVPLGSFLSGGLDSSSIVALMHELGVSPIKTFSIGFEDQSYNESHHARRVAERFGTDHEEFIIQPKALELTEKLIRHLDEPFGDFSIFPTYLVSAMAREHVKVILSGDGGDEVFAGYEHYQAQKLSRLPLLSPLLRLASPVLLAFPPTDKKKGAWNKLRRFVQGLENGPSHRHLRWMMFLSGSGKRKLYAPDYIRALGGIQPVSGRQPFSDIYGALHKFDAVNGELFLDLHSYLVDNILVKVDRMSMAASIETRVPLLDHRLVEFAFSLPGRLKLRGGATKWIFKKTMEGLVPDENIYRPKEGFSIPIKHWLKTDLRELLLDQLSEDRLRRDGRFKPEAVRSMITAHFDGRENYSHQLWALLVYFIWKDTYL